VLYGGTALDDLYVPRMDRQQSGTRRETKMSADLAIAIARGRGAGKGPYQCILTACVQVLELAKYSQGCALLPFIDGNFASP
jgi:hypothetical protein